MTIPTQITPSQLPAAAYLTPTLADSIAKGRHSKIIYNGLVLNDRYQADRYYITEIDGLAGPDVRDNREPRPQAHGEIPYDAYWGGNTMTFTGYIEAGNLWEATRMERDLTAALGTLVESPIKFNWWDVHDDFSDPAASNAYWGTLAGAVTFAGDGTMQFGSTGARVYHKLRQYVDHMVTAKFSFPLIIGDLTAGVMSKCTTAGYYMNFTLSETEAVIGVEGLLTGSVGGANFSPTPGVYYWLQIVHIGDTVTGYVYNQDPFLTTAPPLVTVSTQLFGALSAPVWGNLTQGYAGIFASGTSQLAGLVAEDFRVDALWPSDMVQNVRPISSPSIKSALQVSKNKYKQDFQFTVRASNPRWTSPWTQSETTGSDFSVALVNRGNFMAQTLITLYAVGGTVVNPLIGNLDLDSNKYMLLNGSINNGHYIVVNGASQTLFDDFGNNVFNYFDPTSTFLEMRPGINRFDVSATSGVNFLFVNIAFSNTWK